MRATEGWIRIELDDAWRRELPIHDYFKVTAVTAPMLRAYGYKLTRHNDATDVVGT
jgi:hypothetical protein